MQNLRENSFEMKRNLNSSESARINLPTVMAGWLGESGASCNTFFSKSNYFQLSNVWH